MHRIRSNLYERVCWLVHRITTKDNEIIFPKTSHKLWSLWFYEANHKPKHDHWRHATLSPMESLRNWEWSCTTRCAYRQPTKRETMWKLFHRKSPSQAHSTILQCCTARQFILIRCKHSQRACELIFVMSGKTLRLLQMT
jgi:hypothetical protein